MATIRKLRGRWQAQVRRRGMKPRCKSFDSKQEAERWARDLEAQVDRFGAAPDTKILEGTTLGQLLERYQREICPSSNELRLFGLWKTGVFGSVCGLI